MIPNELRGKKAVPFLEWFNDITDRHLLQYCNMPTLIKIAYFYSQPFSIEMLVNPIQKKEFKNNLNEEENAEVGDIVLEWQQAEEKRIFKGWSMFQDGGIWKYYQPSEESNIMISAYDNKDLYFVVCEDEQAGSIKLNTVNDFITLCNLSEINLTFKK